MNRRMFRTVFIGAIVGAVVCAATGSLYAIAGHAARSAHRLTATSAAPVAAKGKARLIVHSSKRGTFAIVARHLDGGKIYDVIVAGVKVGVIRTTASGAGRATFNTVPRSRDALLGFDPRGRQVLVRDDENGDDVLVADMPGGDPAHVACCVNNDHGMECEDLSAEECTAAGGTPAGVPGGTTAASCLPDPCNGSPPPDHQVVCCTNATQDEASEAECQEVGSDAECARKGGTIVQAASCDPNPCQVTPPANAVACCTSQHDAGGEVDTECRVISAEACTASGGTAAVATSCHPDPCGGPDDGDEGGNMEGEQGGDHGGHHDGTHGEE